MDELIFLCCYQHTQSHCQIPGEWKKQCRQNTKECKQFIMVMIQANMLSHLFPGVTPITEERKKKIAKECEGKENNCILEKQADYVMQKHIIGDNGDK